MEECEGLHGGGSGLSSGQKSSVLGLNCDEERNGVLLLVFALEELVAIHTGITGWLLRKC